MPNLLSAVKYGGRVVMAWACVAHSSSQKMWLLMAVGQWITRRIGTSFYLKFGEMPPSSLDGMSSTSTTLNMLLKQNRVFSKVKHGKLTCQVSHLISVLLSLLFKTSRSYRWLQYKPGRASPRYPTPSVHESQTSSSHCTQKICNKVLNKTNLLYIPRLCPKYYGV